MEPVTHFMTGACIGRAGLNRQTAYATLAATLAAEAPDIDVLAGIRGPAYGLAIHRGITHTLIAAPFMALAVIAAVWLIDKIWHTIPFVRRHKAIAPQPIRWLWLYLSACLATLSHLVLDWTNNYGIRPFFPFNKRWFEGDLVFIAEPALWAVLGLALLFPWLLSLTDREIGARRVRFRGRAWAIFALAFMVVLWCWRWAEHAHGINLVQNAAITSDPIARIALMPYPANPWRWHAILETPSAWYSAEVDTSRDLVVSDPTLNHLLKPTPTPATAIARQTTLGRAYTDWAQWPVIRDIGPTPAPGFAPLSSQAGQSWTTIEFRDLRFAYSWRNSSLVSAPARSLSRQIEQSPLSAWVYVLNSREEAGQFMDGREQP